MVCAMALTSCADMRPALTTDGLPDPERRMTVMGWYLDPQNPKEAAVMTFMYPVGSSSYQSQVMRVGDRLHQYRLDAIEYGVPPFSLPSLKLTDLDTRLPVILKQDHMVNGVREFSEEAVAKPAVPTNP